MRHAVEDWLAHGLGRQSAATVTKYRHLCAKQVLPALGAWKLRDLSAAEVDQWLAGLSLSHSTRTVQEIRACLNRSVKRAMARDKVKRNVVELTEVPTGQPGRQSKSLSAEQADDVLTKTTADRLHSYIVVSLLTGARTRSCGLWAGSMSTSTRTPDRRIWKCGDRCELTAIRRPESRAAPWPQPVFVSTRFESSECSRRRTGWPLLELEN